MYVSITAARTPFYIQNFFISYYGGTQNLTFPDTTNAETTSQCSYSCCLKSKQELGKEEFIYLLPEMQKQRMWI